MPKAQELRTKMAGVKSTAIKVLLIQIVVLAGLWFLQQAFL
jgi:hypothetical protein